MELPYNYYRSQEINKMNTDYNTSITSPNEVTFSSAQDPLIINRLNEVAEKLSVLYIENQKKAKRQNTLITNTETKKFKNQNKENKRVKNS